MAKMIGGKGFLGIGKETTYGTAVAPTKYLRLMSESLGLEFPHEFDDQLTGEVFRTNPYEGQKKVSGDIVTKCHFEGMELLLYQLMGDGATPGTLVTGVGKWDFVAASDGALPTGLTLHMNRHLKKWPYEGCKITSAEFRYESGKALEATFSILGETLGATAACDTASFPTHSPVLATYGALTIDGTPRCTMVKSARIRIENGLEEDMYTICSNEIVEPERGGLCRISGELEIWWDTTMITAVHDKFAAGTVAALVITHTGGEIPGSSPGTDYKFELNLPYIKFGPTADPQLGSGGVISTPIPFEGYKGNGSEPFTITVWNSNQTPL
jgi:hypothetical protein